MEYESCVETPIVPRMQAYLFLIPKQVVVYKLKCIGVVFFIMQIRKKLFWSFQHIFLWTLNSRFAILEKIYGHMIGFGNSFLTAKRE